MIDFDKNIDRDDIGHSIKDIARDKKIKQTTERNINVDYDFADRDVTSMTSSNEMLSRVVREDEKIEKPSIDEKASVKRKLSKISDYNNTYSTDDIEMTK